MKTTLIRAVFGFLAVLPFAVTSCMMSDTEDYPDFNEQLQKDLQAIDAYLTANNIDADQDVDGFIRYVIHRDSLNTPKPTIDGCATVNYEGLFLSTGTKFDEGDNFSFPVNSVIDGWKIAIPLLNVNDSATLYIPSGLGYGFNGFEPDIPGNANLIFHVGITKAGTTYKPVGGTCE